MSDEERDPASRPDETTTIVSRAPEEVAKGAPAAPAGRACGEDGDLQRLQRVAAEFAACHLPGLECPQIRLGTPSHPSACVQYQAGSSGGIILVRSSLLGGTHPSVREGDPFREGRLRYVSDLIARELLRAFSVEVLNSPELAYRGHGPRFRDLANQIGAQLGLPPVRGGKKRGKERDLPSCAEWPVCVRDPEYYLGALRAAPAPTKGDRLTKLRAVLAAAEGGDLNAAKEILRGLLARPG